MSDLAQKKKFAIRIVKGLRAEYPDAECALRFESPLQLLIATILSAQCTDVRVNIVTGKLFAKYPTAAHFAKARLSSIEKAIQSTGFFRNKARNIKKCCQVLVEEHHGLVPQDINVLVRLPGVGRKTANVVLGTAFGLATGVVVDTHVGRISRRLGMTDESDPVKVERDLMTLLPSKEWVDYSHRMIHHGRKVCKARRPLCDNCRWESVCPRVGINS